MAESDASITPCAKAVDIRAVESAFAMLHPGVQRQLWRMGWRKLRQLQVDAIRLVMTTNAPLVLAAATASGKTEAAFLPILSQLGSESRGSVRAMYVGPLKALINDQFSRIEELCEHLDVPVFRWHGDVSAAHKSKLIHEPGGALLITPESLESLFVNRSQVLGKLFHGLRYVVIDELHSFLGDERGLQLRSLLTRLQNLRPDPGSSFRPIGLSATIGDFAIAQSYLDPQNPSNVHVIEDASGAGKELKFRIHGYGEEVPAEEDGEPSDDPNPSDVVYRTANDLVSHCAGAANLVFTNVKGDAEEYADLCSRIAGQRGLRDAFLVHHGSLSADLREETEEIMKSGAAATTLCSSTLEMGVDIGSVKMVGQVGAPWSVASLKQRLGRSGRREGEPQVMRMYLRCRRPGPGDDVIDRLHLSLVQGIAVTELMLQGWVEPPSPPKWDLSTLTQQIISVIAQTGGCAAADLYDRLCVRGPFKEVDQRSFGRLLRQLASKDVVEQMDAGDLILGLVGERIRRDRGFYAVFPTPEQYTVLNAGQVLGSLESAHERGDHLLFAGKRWLVTDVDQERLELHVVPAHGRKRPRFGGTGGDVHAKVRERMRTVLTTAVMYPYLDAEGSDLLRAARAAAADAGIPHKTIIPLGPHRTALLTWTGSRAQETLLAMFGAVGAEPVDRGIALEFDAPELAVRDAIHAARGTVSTTTNKGPLGSGRVRKYDWLLGPELTCEAYRRGRLDFQGARELLARLAEG